MREYYVKYQDYRDKWRVPNSLVNKAYCDAHVLNARRKETKENFETATAQEKEKRGQHENGKQASK